MSKLGCSLIRMEMESTCSSVGEDGETNGVHALAMEVEPTSPIYE